MPSRKKLILLENFVENGRIIKERPYNTYTFGEVSDLKSFKHIGICRVFCYESGGDGVKNRITYYVDVSLRKSRKIYTSRYIKCECSSRWFANNKIWL
jgi:hypothetical protein